MKRRARRGQAVIELSVLMIVFVPMVLYAMFIDDLLRHRLDLLEAVVTSPWDFAAIDQQTNKGEDLGGLERLSWCDHTLAYNSHDQSFECDDQNHHKAYTAHVCWVVEGGQQVQCNRDSNSGMIDAFAMIYNGGGVTTCSARAGVFNYFLPQKALEIFAKEDLTSTEQKSGGVHGHYNSPSSNIFMLEKQQFAILHDTWATKTPDDVDAMTDFIPALDTTSFKGRVQPYYLAFGISAFSDALDFLDKADQEKTIDGTIAQVDGTGDSPYTLHMSFNKTPGTGFGMVTKHTSSAWSDQRVQDTNGARKDMYFGVDESIW